MPFSADLTTTDSYQYLECPGSTRVTVQVSNAAVSIGFGEAPDALTFRKGAATYPPSDEVLLPTIGGLWRVCDEVRIRSYALGVPADVKITAQ
jgi:hypothetical protein